MAKNEAPILNPNTADEEELRQLPGIGPQLAGRIVEGRPYESLEDLRRVGGLGDRSLKTLGPFLAFEAPELEKGADAAQEPVAPGQPEPTRTRRADAEPLKYPLVLTEPKPKGTGRWGLIAIGVASVLCSVTLTLAIMAGINGTLNFGRHAALLESQSELRQIQSQLEAIQVETESLRGQAEALSGVSGRMAEVEGQIAALDEQINGALVAVDEMRAGLATALEETRAQADRVSRFEAFLDGLSRLVGQVITEP